MLIDTLLAQAANQPDESAVHDENGSHTYRQLAALAASIGQTVAATTQRPNVGLLLPSGAGFVGSFYGTLWVSKSVVPINFLLSQREIAHVIADSGIDSVITHPILAAKFKDLPLKVIDITRLTPAAALPPVPAKNADDMAVLMYTSGTIGLPKGVMLSYGNLQSDVDAAIAHAALRHRHKFLGMIPLFHSFGMTAAMLAPIQLGSTSVFMARFSPASFVKAIAEHGASVLYAVPSMYAACLHMKEAGPKEFENVYATISGGEPLPPRLNDAFQQRFGQRIYEGYGLTETSPVISINVPQSYRANSVGRPVPGVVIRIIGDDGTDQPVGQTGELWVRGPMVMKGYYHLPQETADALTPDGFFKTGDLARFDADGFLYIAGRKKDLIIIAGEKAVPREIEEALLTHPAVAEAAVVGKKDPSRGEVVVAFITFKEGQTATPDALRHACRDHGLPQWKVPREIFIEQSLPRSPTGKVLKRVLSEKVNAPA
jgi:long-chain acyl-CoA synthetase